MVDKRNSRRVRTVVTGTILFDAGRSRVECILCDMSTDGARLKLTGPVAVPDVFDLILPLKDTVYPASVCWRMGDEIGVALGSPRDATETVDLDLIERLA